MVVEETVCWGVGVRRVGGGVLGREGGRTTLTASMGSRMAGLEGLGMMAWRKASITAVVDGMGWMNVVVGVSV